MLLSGQKTIKTFFILCFFTFLTFCALSCQQGQERAARAAQKATRKLTETPESAEPKVIAKGLAEVCQAMGIGWELSQGTCLLKTPTVAAKDLCALQQLTIEGEHCFEPAQVITGGEALCAKFEVGASYDEASKKCMDSKNKPKDLKDACISFGDAWTFNSDAVTCSTDKHLIPEKPLCNRLATTHVAWVYDSISAICSASISSIPQEKLCSYLESGWAYDSTSDQCIYGKM